MANVSSTLTALADLPAAMRAAAWSSWATRRSSIEPSGEGTGRLPLLDLGEGFASPEAEGLLEQARRGGRLRRCAGGRQQALEAEPVELDHIGVEPVATGQRHHRRSAEPFAQAPDVIVQADRGVGRGPFAEHRARQGIERSELTGLHRQGRQHPPFEHAAEFDLGAVALLDTERPEGAEEHGEMVRRPPPEPAGRVVRASLGPESGLRAGGE